MLGGGLIGTVFEPHMVSAGLHMADKASYAHQMSYQAPAHIARVWDSLGCGPVGGPSGIDLTYAWVSSPPRTITRPAPGAQ